MADDSPEKSDSDGDVIAVGPRVGPDSYVFARPETEGPPTLGIMRQVREGEDISQNNAFMVEPKDPSRGLYHAKVLHIAPVGKPAKVSTPAFRSGWDAVFGKQTVGQA